VRNCFVKEICIKTSTLIVNTNMSTDDVLEFFYDVYGDRVKNFIMTIQSRNICYLCNVRFARKEDLNEHMQGFHAEICHKCTFCRKTCNSWESFHEHIYSDHGYRIFCTYCYKSYVNTTLLMSHWKNHGKK